MKKFFKTISYLLLASIILVVLEYARQGFVEDLSMQPYVFNQDERVSPIYLVSYVDGPEYFYRNQNAMTHYAINKGIDFILNYKKHHINLEFYEKNKEIFSVKTGGGMWLWKPYIIYETLKNSPENSVILYLDAAFKIKKHLNQFFKLLDSNDIILAHDHDRKNGSFVKGDSFALLDCEDEACRNASHIMSGAILVKNTPYSREFIKKWLDAMQDIRILSNEQYGIKENYPEYKWHHFDQSVLSLIYHKNPSKIKMIEFDELSEYFSLFHRKPSKSSPNKAWYSVYGIDPLINFNKYGKTLPSTSLLNIAPVVYIRKKIIEYFFHG